MALVREVGRILDLEGERELDLIREVQKGLPVASLDRLQAYGEMTDEEMDAVIPRRTRRHQQTRERLSTEQSDRVARTADVFARAHRIFGDAGRANRWMKRPHPELEDRRPLDLLRFSSGAQVVLDLLGRIEHGVYG